MKAIIAAGGSGTRLRPLTFSSNKHLLPIANKPLLLYPIEAIAQTGIKEVGVIVNETRLAVEGFLGTGEKWGLKITYINQEKPLGLAHVVKIAKDFLDGEPFVYHLGDNIFTQGIMKPFEKFVKEKPDALLTIIEHEENYRLGVPYFDDKGNLVKVVEKPQNPPNKFGVPGLYFFNHNVFKAFEGDDQIKPSQRGELEITELYTYLLDHGYKVIAEEVAGRWMDPGKFTDMLEANAFLLKQNLKDQAEVAETAKVSESKLDGPVSIAGGCVINNCELGPNVSIAQNCTLEGVKVKNSIIMPESTLTQLKKPVVDSMIGKNTRVWEENQDTVSLFIGDNCSVKLS